MFKRFALVLACLFAGTATAYADSVTLTFTGLQNLEAINNYYNGGTGGNGSKGGANYGVSFTPDSLAVISNQDGGTGNLDKVPAPGSTTAAFFLSGAGDTMNVAAGFNTGFSFYYAAPGYEGTVSVYSGLNGTGTLLGTDTLALNGSFCDGSPDTYSCWTNSGVSFSGTAESAVFSGVANYIAFADITLGSASVPPPTTATTPEPPSVLLMLTGLFGLGAFALKQQRKPLARWTN